MSAPQLALVIVFPLLLAAVIARICRQRTRLGWYLLTFLLGMIVVLPVSRLDHWIEPFVAGVTGHFYADEWLQQFLATALPEEWGKGLVALTVWWLAGRPREVATVVTFAAVAHCGFAATEGVLGALGNEGWLKVAVGRSLGTAAHCFWGVITAWLIWLGCQHRRWCILNWCLAALLPGVLHATGNAAVMEIPGVPAEPNNETPSLRELAVVLPGLFAGVLTWGLAIWGLVYVRKCQPA